MIAGRPGLLAKRLQFLSAVRNVLAAYNRPVNGASEAGKICEL